MREQPLVTVIMTAYNSSQTIAAAIDSVMAQDYPRIELLIVDDLSSDNTVATVESLMQRYKNHRHKIVLMKNPINVGTYVSKNKAIQAASGSFITGHDSDDRSLPNYVSTLMKPHLSNQQGVKITAVECAGRSSKKGKTTSVFCCISQCFSKKLIEEIGYFDSVRFAADSEFYRRCRKIFGNSSVLRIKQLLYLVDRTSTSLTGNSATGFHSTPRKFYVKQFTGWHRNSTRKELSESFREFPLKRRPFKVHHLSTRKPGPAVRPDTKFTFAKKFSSRREKNTKNN